MKTTATTHNQSTAAAAVLAVSGPANTHWKSTRRFEGQCLASDSARPPARRTTTTERTTNNQTDTKSRRRRRANTKSDSTSS